MNNVKEIQLPEGFEIDRIENNKIILKETNPIDKLPNSWDDYYEYFRKYPSVSTTSFTETEEILKTFEALNKLIILRDVYRMGWTPDWNDCIHKYTLMYNRNEIIFEKDISNNKIFAFQSEEIRNKFYNNFKDLLEKIKPLYL